MDSDFKKKLIKNALSHIDEEFPHTDALHKEFLNNIAKISVMSTVTVLEEYEKLKDEK